MSREFAILLILLGVHYGVGQVSSPDRPLNDKQLMYLASLSRDEQLVVLSALRLGSKDNTTEHSTMEDAAPSISTPEEEATPTEILDLTPLNASGFHYEFQSELGFVVNEWSFILNVEYSALKIRLDQLENVTRTLIVNMNPGGRLANCSWEDNGGYARELNYIVERKISYLNQLHDSIEYLLMHRKVKGARRSKRSLFGGVFNFVGRFYKYTMGVMDDRDAELLYNVVDHMNVTDYRVKLLTNETLEIVRYLDSVKHDLENVINCHYLERQLVYLKDNLEEIETAYNKIIAGIQMALYNNRLSSFIINPQTILNEMSSVESKEWDKTTEWVVPPNHENMHTIMQLINCNVFINPRNELMFIIQVPRVDRTKYNLYKPLSVPACYENSTCKFLSPQSQYIGFENKAKEEGRHYIRLDDTSTCRNLNNKTLCFGSVTSNKIKHSRDCDVRLFKHMNISDCAVHASHFHDEIFYSLNNMNRWLYMVGQKPIHASLNCGTGKYDIKFMLKGTGVLTLKKYCKLRTTNSVLISKHVLDYNADSIHIVNFNFSKYILPEDYNLGDKMVKSLDYDTLNDITRNLKQLVSQETADNNSLFAPKDDNSNANWYSNLFGNWWWELKLVMYLICIVIVIFIVLFIRKTCCCGAIGK
ncbi:EFP [Plodia interpunctella granulovirus]|uniref:EFP n=1 Tax=Plodia interpunctella granulovirus TaxID=262175 RepID=A0A1L5JGJ5_9BBAC|nr:EFP [Plodia interpunctella granulovirus]APO13911.1 EFP [Plodia interpunctella granulovirus]